MRSDAATRPKCFCTGKRRPLQNDVLDIGTYRTRPARHGSKRKITLRGRDRVTAQVKRMHEGVQQQHKCCRSAASGRVIEQPSDHDAVNQEEQVLL